MEMAKEMKEAVCMVAQIAGGFDAEIKINEKRMKESVKHVLPDGTEILLEKERWVAPEVLFNSERVGKAIIGVHEMLISSISKADIDLRASLHGDIYISGAGSKLPGFSTRILNEVKKQNLDNIPVIVLVNMNRLR